MNGTKIFYVLLILLFTACESGNEPVQTTIIEGETTIYCKNNTSSPFFSFKLGKPIPIGNPEGLTPDLLTMIFTNERGDPFGVGFCSLSIENKNINFLGQQEVFDTISQISDKFYNMNLVAEKNQVYSVKTHDNKYSIILIKDVQYFKDTSNTIPLNYNGYITFKWKYQTNGSRNFKN